jgi:hypothetical protein
VLASISAPQLTSAASAGFTLANSWIAQKCMPAAAGRLQIFLGYLPDSEVVDPLAGFQFCSKPARRLASSRPRLGRPVRIPELRNDGWIWASPCRRILAFSFDTTLELLQAILEHALLREQRGCQPGGYFFVECPQLIRGHRFEVIPIHDRPQSRFDTAVIVGRKHEENKADSEPLSGRKVPASKLASSYDSTVTDFS